MTFVEYTEEEWRAIEHVEKRMEEDGSHSLNSCPIHCRAMCKFRKILTEIAQSGRWPADWK